MTAAALLIHIVWVRFLTSPTITSVETTHYPISHIPFPAVTICNINKVQWSAAFSLYENSNLKNSFTPMEYYGFVQQLAEIIQPESVNFEHINLTSLEEQLKRQNLTIEIIMKILTQPCSQLLIKCKWRGELTPCMDLFTQEKTDSGFCCSFNYFPTNAGNDGENVRRANGAGFLTGLTVLMDPQLEDYYAALLSIYGVQILVHTPINYPEVSAKGYLLSPKVEAFMQVSAESTYTTSSVRNLSLKQRQCLFQDESGSNRSLTGGEYTFENCVTLCKVQHLKKICDCVPYFYPVNISIRQCGLQDIKCLSGNRKIFNNLKPNIIIPSLGEDQSGIECDCLPSCNGYKYKIEVSEGTFFKSVYDRTNFFEEINITNHSIVHVFFKDLSAIRFRTHVAYTWNDLLASFGGIVGLCVGCSLLTVIEVLYFFVIRPLINYLTTLQTHKHPRPIKIYPSNFKGTSPIYFDWVN